MNQIELGYGRRSFEFSFDEARFSVVNTEGDRDPPLTDFQIGAALDAPLSSPPIDELVSSDDSVLIVVSDATRSTASAQVVNLLVRRLVQAGVSPSSMAVIFATGIHRPVTEKEKLELLTPFIVQRLRVLAHDANTIVDEKKQATRLFCGDWRLAHRAACDYSVDHYSARIPAKRDIVIVSSGGFPHDINLVQAHKALDMAALACHDGGTIILLAECRDGLGRPDFLKWFDARDARALAARLVNGYEVNGQTAWALLTKAERFRVCLVSELPDDQVRQTRMVPARTIEEALAQAGSGDGFIMPRGAAVLPRIQMT